VILEADVSLLSAGFLKTRSQVTFQAIRQPTQANQIALWAKEGLLWAIQVKWPHNTSNSYEEIVKYAHTLPRQRRDQNFKERLSNNSVSVQKARYF